MDLGLNKHPLNICEGIDSILTDWFIICAISNKFLSYRWCVNKQSRKDRKILKILIQWQMGSNEYLKKKGLYKLPVAPARPRLWMRLATWIGVLREEIRLNDAAWWAAAAARVAIVFSWFENARHRDGEKTNKYSGFCISMRHLRTLKK